MVGVDVVVVRMFESYKSYSKRGARDTFGVAESHTMVLHWDKR